MNTPTTAQQGTALTAWNRAKNHIVSFFVDHPWAVSLMLVGLVVVHGVVASIWVDPLNPYKTIERYDGANSAVPIAIYVAVSASAAILAGLVGVILIFTIGSPSERITRFRTRAGRPLQRTWLVALTEPCIAALLGIIASITQTTGARTVAPWMMEAGLAFLVHGAARTLLILRELVMIVAADDHTQAESGRQVSLAHVFRNRQN